MAHFIRFIKKSFLYSILVKLYDYAHEKYKLIALILRLLLKKFNTDIAFFIPSYGTGGAEWVHLEILKTISNRKPLVFFTSVSPDEKYKKDFNNLAICFCLAPLIWRSPFFKKSSLRIIARKINHKKKFYTFGSDSKYYYELIPFLKDRVLCYDLFHTLVHEFEDGPESWSKLLVDRIDKRITYNLKTINDLKAYYKKFSISETNNAKLCLIYNKFEVPESITIKKYNDVINFLYVGRNDKVKRIHLIGRIAKVIKENPHTSSKYTFNFIGPDLEESIESDCLKYCNFIGHIKDVNLIYDWYRMAHFLLLTSSREGMPITIMESMANGVIPICTNVGGINEIVIDKQTGFLIDNYENENLIVNEIIELIFSFSGQTEQLENISMNAVRYMRNHFNAELFNESYTELFNL